MKTKNTIGCTLEMTGAVFGGGAFFLSGQKSLAALATGMAFNAAGIITKLVFNSKSS